MLIASMIYFYARNGYLSVHELLITLFLFLTAPISANFIAKTYLVQNVRREELPQSDSATGWSIYDDPPGSQPEP